MRCTLVLVLLLLAWPRTQGQPLTEEWKLEVIHRTRGRAAMRGLIIDETKTHVRIKNVFRKIGSPTVVLEELIPRDEIAQIERLDEKERASLVSRLETLSRERRILLAQIQLWRGGKIDLPPGEMLELKPAPWGKDGKGKALSYDSTYFRLVSNARQDIVHLTAVQLEQVFTAYARCLPPRARSPRQATILLTQSLEEYHKLVKESGHNILNPAYFDPRENQVVCGSDLERLSKELSRVREHHASLLKEIQARRKELARVYNGQVPPEILGPLDMAQKRIEALEKKNGDVVKQYHLRLVQRLCHEAFHAYLASCVFADQKQRVPAWLDEGLAQVFETALVEGGELQVGTPDPERLARVKAVLREGQLLPLSDLLRSTARQFQVAHTQERQLSDQHYLAAWGLTFWLTFEQSVLGGERLDEYLKLLEREVDPQEAFRMLAGQAPAEVEKKWHAYLQGLRLDGTSSAKR